MIPLKLIHSSAAPVFVKEERWKNEFIQPSHVPTLVPHLERRYSIEGNLLPIVGFVVDDDVDISLADPYSTEIKVGPLRLSVTEGVANESWQIVLIRRLRSNGVSAHVRDYASMKALHSMGVRQVFSANKSHFEFGRYVESLRARSSDLIDLSDASELMAGSALSMCPRLGSAITQAAETSGFAMMSYDMQMALTSPTRTEAVAAASLGMCYAALDVVQGAAPSAVLAAKSALALRRAPEAISPLATCGCQTIL